MVGKQVYDGNAVLRHASTTMCRAATLQLVCLLMTYSDVKANMPLDAFLDFGNDFGSHSSNDTEYFGNGFGMSNLNRG